MKKKLDACSVPLTKLASKNGGHLQPLLYDTTPEIALFEIENCKTVAAFIEKNGIDCEFRAVSACRSFWTPSLLADAKAAVDRLQSDAPDLAQRITWVKNQAGMEQAQLRATCEGATITDGAASLWPYKYVSWIVRHLVEQKKLNLQTHTAVLQVEPLTDQQESQGRYRVYTERGTITAQHVLLATNAYTSHLLPRMAPLIIPIRETMTALLPPESLSGHLLHHSHGLVGTGLERTNSTEYLTHRPAIKRPNVQGVGHLMLGGARTTAGKLPHFGESDDSVVDEAVVDYLSDLLPRVLDLGNLPDLVEKPKLAVERAWTGIYGQSRDGAPWVGRAPDMPPGLWLCGGYSGHGMPNATLCARAVVEMMTLEQTDGVTGEVDQRHPYEETEWCSKIPKSYLITKERLNLAKSMPQAEEMDRLGIDPLQWIENRK